MATNDYFDALVSKTGENIQFFFSPPDPVVYVVTVIF